MHTHTYMHAFISWFFFKFPRHTLGQHNSQLHLLSVVPLFVSPCTVWNHNPTNRYPQWYLQCVEVTRQDHITIYRLSLLFRFKGMTCSCQRMIPKSGIKVTTVSQGTFSNPNLSTVWVRWPTMCHQNPWACLSHTIYDLSCWGLGGLSYWTWYPQYPAQGLTYCSCIIFKGMNESAINWSIWEKKKQQKKKQKWKTFKWQYADTTWAKGRVTGRPLATLFQVDGYYSPVYDAEKLETIYSINMGIGELNVGYLAGQRKWASYVSTWEDLRKTVDGKKQVTEHVHKILLYKSKKKSKQFYKFWV